MMDRPWHASYPEGVVRSLPREAPVGLFDVLRRSARDFPDRPAVSLAGVTLDYEGLLAQAEQWAAVLHEWGVGKGDRVAIALPNCVQYVVAYYGALRLGAVAVGIDPRSTQRELIELLTDARASVLVAMDPLPSLGTAELPGVLQIVSVVLGAARGEPLPAESTTPTRSAWDDVMELQAPHAPEVDLTPGNDPAALLYTGGTTGRPKAVMLSHRNLVANAEQGAAWFPAVRPGEECVLCVIPFFHSYGMTVCMNIGISIGAELVLMPAFDPQAAVDVIEARRPTIFAGVPALFAALCQVGQGRDLSSIRACMSGADKLPETVRSAFESISGGRISEGFGLSEASPSTHANPFYGMRKSGSLGLPLPDTDCRIADPEDNDVVMADGEIGELLVRGPQVMLGYWNRPEETERAFHGEWLKTGDLAYMDEDGFFFFVDRIKDVVKIKGLSVFPNEVEQVLLRHPEVRAACVVGIPDAHEMDELVAFVVSGEADITESELFDLCEDPVNGLTEYKRPRRIEFRESLPMTTMGKPLRRLLRAKARGA